MKSFTSFPKDMHLRHKSGTKGTRYSYMWMCMNIFIEKSIHTHEELWERDSKTYVTAWKQKGWVRQGNPKGRLEETWHSLPSQMLWWGISSQTCFNAGVDDWDRKFNEDHLNLCVWWGKESERSPFYYCQVQLIQLSRNPISWAVSSCTIPSSSWDGNGPLEKIGICLSKTSGQLEPFQSSNEDIKIDVRFLNINRNKIKSWTTLRRSVFWVSWNKTIISLCSPRNSDGVQHVL